MLLKINHIHFGGIMCVCVFVSKRKKTLFPFNCHSACMYLPVLEQFITIGAPLFYLDEHNVYVCVCNMMLGF